METTKEASSSFVELNSLMTWGTPGANIEEANGLIFQGQLGMGEEADDIYVRKVMAASTAILPFFMPGDQFIALFGSFGPSQSTMLGSTALVGTSSSCSIVDELLRPPDSKSFSLEKPSPSGVLLPFCPASVCFNCEDRVSFSDADRSCGS